MDMEFAGHGWKTINGKNPAMVNAPWSRIVIILLCLTALVSPFPCLVAAPVAFALSKQDDGILLASVGGAHMLLAWALFGGA